MKDLLLSSMSFKVESILSLILHPLSFIKESPLSLIQQLYDSYFLCSEWER